MNAAACRLVLRTRDGELLPARHLPRRLGPGGAPTGVAAPAVALVVAHGFGFGGGRPQIAALAERLRELGGVITFDFRGHGSATGLSTIGDREVHDVDAAVTTARQLGYDVVVTLGFSMGGSAVLRHAGLVGEVTSAAPDAVVAVSTGSRWHTRDSASLRRLGWVVSTRPGRLAARLAWGVRVDPRGWPVPPASAEEVVGRIAPRPLLLVHGDADAYFPLRHVTDLAAATAGHARVVVVPGFGHAELAVTPQVAEILVGAVAELIETIPARPPARVGREARTPVQVQRTVQ